MDSWISLVTLGVSDVARAARFYRAMGWRPSSAGQEGVVAFFHSGTAVLGLYRRDLLAADAGIEDEGATFSGMAVAHNVANREQVDGVLAEAEAAGGRILATAEDTEWGGRSGYFADPDGHPWEVAWNPGFPLDADGRPQLPD